MRKTLKPLKRVKDRFSLFNDGRTLDANKRRYIIKSVQDTIASAKTKENLRLGESYGFYGHAPRQRAKKLDLGETEVINIGGRPVVVENIPSNRTISISCDDDGVVTHEQEFLDTETGKIALSLWESGAGGWSWATGGSDGRNASVARTYHGMDYVLQPNYLSLDHPSMMLESVGSDMLLESLQKSGFNEADAQAISDSMQNAVIADNEAILELEQNVMYLESVNREQAEQIANQQSQIDMMLEATNKLPIFITDEQKAAMMDIGVDDNFKTVQAMFESVGSSQAKTLPMGFEPTSGKVGKQKIIGEIKDSMIDFGGASRTFQ